MRRSFDSLAGMVSDHCRDWNAMSGAVFIFVNRTGDRIKALWWDKDGYALWYKRLEQGTFRLSDKRELTYAELCAMLEGVEVKVVRRQKRYAQSALTN
jgi:transposase